MNFQLNLHKSIEHINVGHLGSHFFPFNEMHIHTHTPAMAQHK